MDFRQHQQALEGPRTAVRDAEPLDDASLRLANIPDRGTRSLQSRRFIDDGFFANINRPEGPRTAVRDAEPLDDASLRLANIPDRDTRSLQSRPIIDDGFFANINRPWRDRVPRSG
jgi:hypothetical protein